MHLSPPEMSNHLGIRFSDAEVSVLVSQPNYRPDLSMILLGRVSNDASVTISASVQSGSVGSLALFESDEDHFPLFYSAAAFSSGARRTRSTPSETELHRSAVNDK